MLAQIASAGRKLHMFEALRHKNFRWYFLGSTGQAVAQGMQFLVLGWLVLEITDSSSQLGLVIFLYGIPNAALLIFGGLLADRMDRRLLLVTSRTIVTAIIAVIATLTIADVVALWHIYVISFILGTVQGINSPARIAIVSDLVDRDDLMNATALSSAVMNSGRIVGPALGGVLIEFGGIGSAFVFNASFYAIGVIFMLLVRGEFAHGKNTATNFKRDVAEGVRYLASTPIALTIIGIGFAFGLFAAAYMQVMPAFAKEVLGVSAGGAGLLISAAGFGSLVGSLTLASLGNFQHKNWLLLGTLLTFCFSLFLFAISPWFWASWIILLLVGMGSMGFVSVGTTVLQLTAPPEVLGRVMSFWLLGSALQYVGALPLGVMADTFSWPISIASGAATFLLIVLWFGVKPMTLRHLKV